MLAFLISIQPGTSSTVSTCISLSSSLDALLEPRDVVSDTLAPDPLDLVRGKEHLETIALFTVVVAALAEFHRYRDVFCLLFVLRCQGCLLLWATAPGQSSPDQLVTLLLSSHQPVALQLTS